MLDHEGPYDVKYVCSIPRPWLMAFDIDSFALEMPYQSVAGNVWSYSFVNEMEERFQLTIIDYSPKSISIAESREVGMVCLPGWAARHVRLVVKVLSRTRFATPIKTE